MIAAFATHLRRRRNIVKQITVPDHIAPADNVVGQHSGLDRHHPLFEQYRELQHARALETLAEILGTDDTSKALPESETIIFEAVSEKREGAEFQLYRGAEGRRAGQRAVRVRPRAVGALAGSAGRHSRRQML